VSGSGKTHKKKLRSRKLKSPVCAVCGKVITRDARVVYGCLVHNDCVTETFREETHSGERSEGKGR
jgi:hypothetical protein